VHFFRALGDINNQADRNNGSDACPDLLAYVSFFRLESTQIRRGGRTIGWLRQVFFVNFRDGGASYDAKGQNVEAIYLFYEFFTFALPVIRYIDQTNFFCYQI